MSDKKKKYLSKEDALDRLQRYCAYQDRCHQEVRTKLIDLGIYGDDLEEIIVELIHDRFLDELRFAQSYARGKFRNKKWGRHRILRELKRKDISEYCIRKAMEEIEEEEYLQTLGRLLEKKDRELKEKDVWKRKKKLAVYVIGKGYESPLVWEILKKKFP